MHQFLAEVPARDTIAPPELAPATSMLALAHASGTKEAFTANGFRIVLDNARDAKLTAFGKKTLSERYLLPGETYQRLFGRVACAYADDEAHAHSNGGTTRGLPISCLLGDRIDLDHPRRHLAGGEAVAVEKTDAPRTDYTECLACQ